VNNAGHNLAKLNLTIAGTPTRQPGQPAGPARRMLQQLSQYGDITTTIAANTVNVRWAGSQRPMLVIGHGQHHGDEPGPTGAISYTLGGTALTLSGGSLAGTQQAMAASISARQSRRYRQFADDDGERCAGQWRRAGRHRRSGMFSGTGAAGITMALTSQPDCPPHRVRRRAAEPDQSEGADLLHGQRGCRRADEHMLYNLSSAVASNTTTRDTLDTIHAMPGQSCPANQRSTWMMKPPIWCATNRPIKPLPRLFR
jgi:flagellar hook-associated protein 1 FlgK